MPLFTLLSRAAFLLGKLTIIKLTKLIKFSNYFSSAKEKEVWDSTFAEKGKLETVNDKFMNSFFIYEILNLFIFMLHPSLEFFF